MNGSLIFGQGGGSGASLCGVRTGYAQAEQSCLCRIPAYAFGLAAEEANAANAKAYSQQIIHIPTILKVFLYFKTMIPDIYLYIKVTDVCSSCLFGSIQVSPAPQFFQNFACALYPCRYGHFQIKFRFLAVAFEHTEHAHIVESGRTGGKT